MLTAQAGRVGLVVAVAGALLTGCQGSSADQSAPDPAGTGHREPTQVAAGSVSGRPAGAPPVVLLDPGHSGGTAGHAAELSRQVPNGRGGTKPCNNTGTSTDAGYPEHTFNWDVAQRTKSLLQARGATVVLTRSDDTGLGPCVNDRGTAGQRANADAVVSIHADGAPAARSGYHVALSDPPVHPAQEEPARRLATAMRDAMRSAGFPDSDYVGRDGMSPRSDLAGLNLATRPAVLVECANMRNPTEAAFVSSPEGRERYGAAIAAGVLAFLGR